MAHALWDQMDEELLNDSAHAIADAVCRGVAPRNADLDTFCLLKMQQAEAIRSASNHGCDEIR